MNNNILKFLGSGSCFNTKDGNNSAYYKNQEEKYLLLIDCGETVFERLIKEKILEGVEELTILITHMHTDHIGSLSSLIFYCEYVKKIVPTIIYPAEEKIKKFLNIVGNEPKTYKICEPNKYKKIKIEEVKQKHSKYIDAYGYIIDLDSKRIYYSGDTKIISEEIIELFNKGEFSEFYQDVSRYENDAHINIKELVNLIDQSKRKKITCMHFDDDYTRSEIERYGFNTIKLEK